MPAVPEWRVRLFGQFLVEGAGRRIDRFRTRQTTSAFIFLALTRGQRAGRAELAGLLWPDDPPERARHSLRTALSDIRARLGRQVVAADGEWVWLDPDRVETDVGLFVESPRTQDCPEPLLPDWDDAWLTSHRAELEDLFSSTAILEMDTLPKAEALKVAERCLLRDPVRLDVRAKLTEFGLFPAPKAAGGPSTSFVGRVKEIEQLAALFACSRLVTVTGLGGSGKSRLAAEFHRRQKSSWFVSLGDCLDGSQIERAICHRLGLPEAVGRSPFSQIAFAIGEAEGCLVLDNFEHLLDRADFAEALLAECPNLRILTTSQVPLRTPSEVCFSLGPLSLESQNGMASEAVALFLERAKAIDDRMATSAEWLDSIQGICQKVDGFPLAIELATAKLRVSSPREILEQLGSTFEFLSRDHGMLRHQSLRNALDWSFDCLSAAQQEVLLTSTVFRRGFTLASLNSVTGKEDVGSDLDVLAASCWIQRSWREQTVRFSLLEAVRSYVMELLSARKAFAVSARHSDVYLDLARRALDAAFTTSEEEIHRQLDSEEANLEAAFDWLLENRPMGAVELISCLNWYCIIRSRSPWAEGKLAAAYRRAIPDTSTAFCYSHHAMGNFLVFQGRYAESVPWFERAVEMAPLHGIKLYEAVSTQQLAYVNAELGCFEKAESFLQRAMELVSGHGNLNWMGTMGTIGILLCNRQQKWKEAIDMSVNVLRTCRAGGYRWGLASALNEAAFALRQVGDFQRALELDEESAGIKREASAPRSLAISLLGIAEASLHVGDLEKARQSLSEASSILCSLADWHSLPAIYSLGGKLATAMELQGLAGACHQVMDSGAKNEAEKEAVLEQLAKL